MAGFKIYHGTSSGNYTSTWVVSNAAARQTTVTSLPSGIRFFSATVYNIYGTESGYSNEVNTIIGAPKSPTGIGISKD